MQIRNIILGVVGLGVFLALVLLAVQVSSGPEREVDAAELERAKAMHERFQSQSAPERAPPIPKPRASRTRTRQPPPSRAEPEEEPDPNEPIDRGGGARVAPEVSIVGESLDKGTQELMTDVRKVYDRGDYLAAEELALEAVKRRPRHIKMLRYVVSASCALGKEEQARQYFQKLPRRDKRHMRARCQKWDVEFDEE